jgi:hypothetical protein
MQNQGRRIDMKSNISRVKVWRVRSKWSEELIQAPGIVDAVEKYETIVDAEFAEAGEKSIRMPIRSK